MTGMAATGEQCLPLLDHLARVARRAAESSLAPSGLKPRHLIALRLLDEHSAISQQALAEVLSLDPSNVVGLLNELEERGLITRRRDTSDRRRHIVELSVAGRAELDAAQHRMSQAEDEVFGALTAEERTTLHQLLTRAAGGKGSRQVCTEAAGLPASACSGTGGAESPPT